MRDPDPVSHKSRSGSNTEDVLEHPSRMNMSLGLMLNELAQFKLKLPELCIELQMDMRGPVMTNGRDSVNASKCRKL